MTPHYAKSQVFSLTAVARDPHTIFVCWDVAAFGSDKLNGKVGGNVRAIAGWCLRVNALDSSFSQDYAITPEAGKYYIGALRAGTDYKVSLLLQDTVQEKHLVSSCGPLALPNTTVSDAEMRGWEINKEAFIELFGDNPFGESSHG